MMVLLSEQLVPARNTCKSAHCLGAAAWATQRINDRDRVQKGCTANVALRLDGTDCKLVVMCALCVVCVRYGVVAVWTTQWTTIE